MRIRQRYTVHVQSVGDGLAILPSDGDTSHPRGRSAAKWWWWWWWWGGVHTPPLVCEHWNPGYGENPHTLVSFIYRQIL